MGFDSLSREYSSVSRREFEGAACNRESCGCATCPVRDICAGPNKRCDARNCDRDCSTCLAVCNRHDRREEIVGEIGGPLFDHVGWEPFDIGVPPRVLFQLNTPLKEDTAARGFVVNVRRLFYGDPGKGGSLNWSPRKALRARFRIPPDSPLGISFCAPDPVVNYLGIDLEETAAEVSRFKADFSFAVNFSIYDNYPSFDAIMNLKKRFISLERLQERGVKVVPDVGWQNYRDRDRVVSWLRSNGVRYAVKNFQTVSVSAGTRNWVSMVEDLSYLRSKCPDLHLFLVGCSSRKRMRSILRGVGGPMSFVDAKAQRLAEFHKDVLGNEDRSVSVGRLFERNVELVTSWLGGAHG